jgi:hypothetical protein
MKIPLNLILGAVLFQGLVSESLLAEDPAAKPNIIFFLVDDLGWPIPLHELQNTAFVDL